jgi:hypothetical protein
MFVFEEVLYIEWNFMPDQQGTIFIGKRGLSMVLFLTSNVSADLRHVGFAHGECCKSTLPSELDRAKTIVIDPFGRAGFDGSEHARNGKSSWNSAKNVNVIFDTTDRIQVSVFAVDDTSDVGVKLRPHACVNQWTTVLSSEDNVIFEARIGRHTSSLRK